MQYSTRRENHLPLGILSLSLMAAYLLTLAPGLTWANDGADGGDLIAAAATNGVAHPTGYPTYLALARIFQALPIGSLAFRTNLMSALFTTLAAVLVYELVRRETAQRARPGSRLAGLAGGFAYGLAPIVWSQAVITEVYALHAFFVALLLYLANLSRSSSSPRWMDRLLGLTLGLAIGNHVTAVLMLPILLTASLSRETGETEINPQPGSRLSGVRQLHGPVLMRRLGWLGAGLLIYLTLPLRALSHSPVNWGNPVTLDGFVWLVTGRLYQDEFLLTLPLVWGRIQSWAALLLGQFGLPGLVVGVTGLVIFLDPSPLRRNAIWTALAFSIFAIVYGTDDSYVYLIPLYLCFAIWIGVGLGGWMEAIARRVKFGGFVLGLVFGAWLFVLAFSTLPQVDASQDLRAEQFGEVVLAQAPDRAIVFAKGDEAVFTLWYFHYVLKERPDLAVVASDLLHFEWYLDALRATYPDLVLPGPLPFTESLVVANPARSVCYVQVGELHEIRCEAAREP